MSELDRDFVEEAPSRGLNLFSLLAVLVLVLSVVLAGFFAVVFLMPDLVPDSLRPSAAVLLNTIPPAPTETPPPPPTQVGAVVPPTWTPSVSPAPSSTATPRGTPTETPTPSLTPTWRPTNTRTPTPTPTETPTDTPTPGPSPTPSSTRSAYPFTLDPNSPIFTANYANNLGCNWLGVAGQVFDLERKPVQAGTYMVWVTESGVNTQAFVGTAPAYGPAGWEVNLHDRPRVATHRIQLFTPSGTPVSEVYEFNTWASCNQNLVLISFLQNH